MRIVPTLAGDRDRLKWLTLKKKKKWCRENMSNLRVKVRVDPYISPPPLRK